MLRHKAKSQSTQSQITQSIYTAVWTGAQPMDEWHSSRVRTWTLRVPEEQMDGRGYEQVHRCSSDFSSSLSLGAVDVIDRCQELLPSLLVNV